MKTPTKLTHLLISATIALFSATFTHAESVSITHVIDGDTVISTSGHHIRLIGINTPELAHKKVSEQPLAKQAKQFTKNWLKGKDNLQIKYEERKKDRYGRLLAHIYDESGNWLNADILKSGMGHLYSFPDNRGKIRELEKFATSARAQKLGIWSLPRWQVYPADKPMPKSAIGKFNLVQGRVVATAKANGIVYLNFGTDWRTDFSVEIRPNALKLFKKVNITPQEHYRGKTLLVRGVIKPVNGALITVSHPEQLTIIN